MSSETSLLYTFELALLVASRFSNSAGNATSERSGPRQRLLNESHCARSPGSYPSRRCCEAESGHPRYLNAASGNRNVRTNCACAIHIGFPCSFSSKESTSTKIGFAAEKSTFIGVASLRMYPLSKASSQRSSVNWAAAIHCPGAHSHGYDGKKRARVQAAKNCLALSQESPSARGGVAPSSVEPGQIESR